MKNTIEEIIECMHDRDWNQFHNPDNLENSNSIESGELLECFHWSSYFIGPEKSVWWF